MRVLRHDGSLYLLEETEILYFTIHQNIIYVHTLLEEYIVPTSFGDVLKAYSELNIEKVDRSFLVNMDKIKGFDRQRKSVYFEDEPNRNSKYVPVSEPNEKKVTGHLERSGKMKKG